MSFIAELKRRNVFKVGAAYVIVAWLVLQVASILFPTFGAPDWVMPVFTAMLIIGFPLVLIVAWAFELTPEGIRLEGEIAQSPSVTRLRGRRLDLAIIALLGVAVIYLAIDRYVIGETSPDSGPTFATTERSIAVLPFRNRSALAEDAFFVDGIHDDILTRLASISALDKVISRTSVEQYRDTRLPIPQIGRELDVAAILEGGVQRSGDMVRINVQLIDAASDDHRWAAAYERKLTAENIFAIQSEIASAIVQELRANLSADERSNLETIPTASMDALEYYFRGKEHLRKRTAASIRKAKEQFHAAIEADPAFVLAHTSLAITYDLEFGFTGVTFQESQRRARAQLAEALALGSQSAETYAVLGSVESFTDPAAAEAAFRKALALSPNSSDTLYLFCYLLGPILGRNAEALEVCQRLLELDPLSPIVHTTTGRVLWGLDRLEEARDRFHRANEIDPSFVVSRAYLAYMDWAAYARLDDAVRRVREAIALDSENVSVLAMLGGLYLDLGDTAKAEFWIERLQKRAPADSGWIFLQARLYQYQGDVTSAIELAREYLTADAAWAAWVDWALLLIRDDALKNDRPGDARQLYAQAYPALLEETPPAVSSANFRAAVDLAALLLRTGETARAEALMNLAQEYISRNSRTTTDTGGYGIADVQIDVMQGDTARALMSLRAAIDSGWRQEWWRYLKQDIVLEPLHDKPEFQAMVRDLEAQMAEQLARVRLREANGELAPIPDSLL